MSFQLVVANSQPGFASMLFIRDAFFRHYQQPGKITTLIHALSQASRSFIEEPHTVGQLFAMLLINVEYRIAFAKIALERPELCPETSKDVLVDIMNQRDLHPPATEAPQNVIHVHAGGFSGAASAPSMLASPAPMKEDPIGDFWRQFQSAFEKFFMIAGRLGNFGSRWNSIATCECSQGEWFPSHDNGTKGVHQIWEYIAERSSRIRRAVHVMFARVEDGLLPDDIDYKLALRAGLVKVVPLDFDTARRTDRQWLTHTIDFCNHFQTGRIGKFCSAWDACGAGLIYRDRALPYFSEGMNGARDLFTHIQTGFLYAGTAIVMLNYPELMPAQMEPLLLRTVRFVPNEDSE